MRVRWMMEPIKFSERVASPQQSQSLRPPDGKNEMVFNLAFD
jgi:hypothetical protein